VKTSSDVPTSWIEIVIGIVVALGLGVVLAKSITVERLDRAPLLSLPHIARPFLPITRRAGFHGLCAWGNENRPAGRASKACH